MEFICLKWYPQKNKILQKVSQTLKEGLPVFRQGTNFYFIKTHKNKVAHNQISFLSPLFLGHIALLWDGSYLFGLMAFWQLKKLDIPFSVIRAEEIKAGILDKHKVLLVPGGWTAPKNVALGDKGREKIKKFVKNGGNYLGICGGAGLGLTASDGLGLLPVKRKERKLANFFGKVKLNYSSHPAWEGISTKAYFTVWWPGLFEIIKKETLKVLASYKDITSDFYITDLNIRDLETYDDLKKWRDFYQINIDVEVLKNEPAILEGRYGKGRVILSYLHLDTPDNPWETLAFFNLYHSFFNEPFFVEQTLLPDYGLAQKKALTLIKKLRRAIDEFIYFGQRQFLWYWANYWMLRWKKGIRGFHYLTLYWLIKKIESSIKKYPSPLPHDELMSYLEKLLKHCLPFLEKAKCLLLKERYLLNKGSLNLISTNDKEVSDLREELFGHTPAYGGKFKEILQIIDQILVPYLKIESTTTSQYKIG